MEALKKAKEVAQAPAKKSWWDIARQAIDQQMKGFIADGRLIKNYSKVEKNYGFVNFTVIAPDGKKFLHAIAYKPNGFGPGLIHFYLIEPALTMEFSEQDYQLNINP
jgi:hypothetical protein